MIPRTVAPDLFLQGVGKSFAARGRTTLALHAVDLVAERGQVVSLVGQSGCGKSTLLRIVAGLTSHDAGQVQVAGRRVTGPGLDCGVVFQDHRLLPWLTVEQNVAFGLEHLSASERQAVVQEYISLVGLSGFEQAYPHQLSGGMAQRAAIARALAPAPRVLLLDEPFAALDALTKLQLQEELARIQRARGTTLLLITHDIEEAVFLSDRVCVFSARPGTLRRAFEVDLPRPRERTSAPFTHLRRAIFDELFKPQQQPVLLSAPRPKLAATEPDLTCSVLAAELRVGENV